MNSSPFQQFVPIPDGVALSCNGCGKMAPIEPGKIHETIGRHGPNFHVLVPGLGWLCWDCYRCTASPND